MARYDHRQRGWLWVTLVVPAVGVLLAGWLVPARDPSAVWVIVGFAAIFLLLAFGFGYLRIRDDGTHLEAAFGPLCLYRKRIPYAKMTGVRRERSRFIDGWGVHWGPFSGLIINLWGYDCVAIELGRKRIRLGTDDPEGLEAFLRARLDAGK